MRTLMTTTMLVGLLAVPNLAQAQNTQPSHTSQPKQARAGQTNIQFVRQQMPKEWSAQALIGRTVYNLQDEELGDINNVVLTEDGRVSAITIGVGGFLGIGEKDVGVPFSALEFRVSTGNSNVNQGAGTRDRTAAKPDSQQTTPATQMDRQSAAGQANRADGERRGTNADDRTAARMDRFDTEHQNVRLYLSADKQRIENAPEFKWLSDQNSGDSNRKR